MQRKNLVYLALRRIENLICSFEADVEEHTGLAFSRSRGADEVTTGLVEDDICVVFHRIVLLTSRIDCSVFLTIDRSYDLESEIFADFNCRLCEAVHFEFDGDLSCCIF